MFKYQIIKANPPATNSDLVLRTNLENGEISSIPMAESNSDYSEFLQWVAQGNTPEEYIPE